MANPFGPVVDNFEMEKWPPYPDIKTTNQLERGRAALRWKYDNNKAKQAEDNVRALKDLYKSGVATHCQIFNATGFTLSYIKHFDHWGRLYMTPYPWEIGNGQWVSFLHTQGYQAGSGSLACIVYLCRNRSGYQRFVVICWLTTGSSPGGKDPNRVLADVVPTVSMNQLSIWWNTAWLPQLRNAPGSSTLNKDGIRVEVNIAQNTSPFFTATISLPD